MNSVDPDEDDSEEDGDEPDPETLDELTLLHPKLRDLYRHEFNKMLRVEERKRLLAKEGAVRVPSSLASSRASSTIDDTWPHCRRKHRR